MTTTVTHRSLRLATWAVFAVFFLNGFSFATWASRLPAVRDHLGFGEAQMGLLMLSTAFGSIVALPLSGLIVQRIGAARAVALFAVVNVVGLVAAVLGVIEGAALVARIGLFACGIGTGVWDAAMNLEGAAVEQKLGRAIMPRFHAGFSFGTMAGAGLGAVAAYVGAPLPLHLGVALAICLVTVLGAVRFFLPAGFEHATETPDAEAAAGPVATPDDGAVASPVDAVADPSIAVQPTGGRRALAAWRQPRTLLIGVVVLAAALTEGSANDWVSLAIVDGFDKSDALGAVGLGVFLTSMTAMRLLGTGLLDRHGRVAILRVSAGLAIVGLVVFALAPSLWLALFGVVFWGMGAALGFPVGMSAASDDPSWAAVRVSVVSTIGYTAFFMGPPLIGLLAEHWGYRHALLVIAVPIAVGLVVAGAARPLPTAAGAESTR